MRFYIVPEISFTIPNSTMVVRGPKYIGTMLNMDGTRLQYSGMRYGFDQTYLVGAPVTDAQHTILDAQADVVVIPQNLDAVIGAANLAIVKQEMETLLIPSAWVTAAHTYREVLGFTGRLFMFFQRFNARHVRKFFESGVTLALRINQLTQPQRDALTVVANEFGLDTSLIVGTTTIRQALKIVGDQMPGFVLMGEAF